MNNKEKLLNIFKENNFQSLIPFTYNGSHNDISNVKELIEKKFSGDNVVFDLTPERKEGESFSEYKVRQKINSIYLKFSRKGGKLRWDSMKSGTYDKRKGHKLIEDTVTQ